MKISRLVRRVVFVIALAITTVVVPARTASAVPRDACQDYVNQSYENLAMSRWWTNLARIYLELGYYDVASEALLNAEVYYGFGVAYTTMYTLECS